MSKKKGLSMPKKNELIQVFSDISEPKTMAKFFREIFTPAEIRNLTLRWQLMKMLKQGITQRKISSKLGISLCKITRGSKIIKDKHSVTNWIINRLEK
jgi:TrpR family trp operon transcriptional repressor